MSGGAGPARYTWAAVVTGLAWAQAGVAMELLVLPGYVALCDNTVTWGHRLARWTLLAPLAAATQVTGGAVASGVQGAAAGPSFATLALCSLVGVGLCLVARCGLATPRWRRATASCCAGAALLGLVCAGIVAIQLRDAVVAERAYFAMVSSVEMAHKDSATVAAARAFVRRHPRSRWVGEGLRIVAMAEWESGHFGEALELWARFARRFRERNAPGVAYAEYSMALCEQRLGRSHAAQRHLRAAIEIIRARGDGIQGWIASDAAARLSACERSEGRYALAGYWKTKSVTFSDVYATK